MLSADKPLVLYGSRLTNYAALGFYLNDFTKDIHCHAHGHKAVANWSSSFSPRHDETFCQIAPNVPLLVTYISHDSLQTSAKDWHELNAFDKILNKEFAVFHPEPYQRFIRAAFHRLMNPSPDPDYSLSSQMTLLTYEMFNQLNTDAKLQITLKRYDLVSDFFKYAIVNQHHPVKIQDVADALYTSNTTLIKGCYEFFGCKPMDVLKNIRLDQTHRALTNKSIQYELGLSKVLDIATHYGFSSRPHFAKNFFEMYGLTPSDALKLAA
jgi:AraC family ethanolamine operon transcriptional activator